MKLERKILFLGLDNTGKTAVQRLLMNDNVFNVLDLPPSRGLNIQALYSRKHVYYIWDLPGYEKKREFYLENNMIYPKQTKLYFY